MNWNRIKCAVLGHKWAANDKCTVAGVAYRYDCERCGSNKVSVPWHTELPTPMRPAPPMPATQPSRKDTISLKVEVVGFDEIEVRTAKLHQQWTEIDAMQRAVLDRRPGGAVTTDGQNINPMPTIKRPAPPAPPPPPSTRKVRYP